MKRDIPPLILLCLGCFVIGMNIGHALGRKAAYRDAMKDAQMFQQMRAANGDGVDRAYYGTDGGRPRP